MKKQVLGILLIVLLTAQSVIAETGSKTLYDVALERLEKKIQKKYHRPASLSIYMFDEEDEDGYTFKGNEDYEIYIDAMAQTLEDHPADTKDMPFYQQPFAYFAYGIIASAMIASAVK